MKKLLFYFLGIINLFSEDNFYFSFGYIGNYNSNSILSSNVFFINDLIKQMKNNIDNKEAEGTGKYLIDIPLYTNAEDDSSPSSIRLIGYPSELFKKIINKKNHNSFQNNFLNHGVNLTLGYVFAKKNNFLFSFESSFSLLNGYTFLHKEIFFNEKINAALKKPSTENDKSNSIKNDKNNIFGNPSALRMICEGEFFQDLHLLKSAAKFFNISCKFGEIFKERLILNLIFGGTLEVAKFTSEKNDFYAKFSPYFWHHDEKKFCWLNSVSYVSKDKDKNKIEKIKEIYDEKKIKKFSKTAFSFGFHIGCGVDFFLSKRSSFLIEYKFFFMSPVTISEIEPASEITFSKKSHSLSGSINFHF